MGKFHDAADVLKRQAVKYESLMSAIKDLEEIGSLEQAADAAKASAAANIKEVEQTSIVIKALEAEAEKIKAANENMVANAKREASEHVASAADKAQTMLETATKDAAQKHARIVADTNGVLLSLNGKIEVAQALKSSLEAEITKLRDVRQVANDEAAAAEARLKAVKDQIAKLVG